MCCKAQCVATPNRTKPFRSHPVLYFDRIQNQPLYSLRTALHIMSLKFVSCCSEYANQNADAFQVGWNCFRVLWYSMLKIHTYTFTVKMVFSLYGVKSDSINFVKSFICWLFFYLLLYSFFCSTTWSFLEHIVRTLSSFIA